MATLKINNNYSVLYAKEDVKEFIRSKLRFRSKDFWHNRSYKSRAWDGFHEFFKKDTGRFLTGLLPEVNVMLKAMGEQVEVVDERTPINFAVNQVDSSFIQGVSLYDYQVDFINQVIKHGRGVIPSPTSSGKTLMMVGGVKALPPKTPTLILANRQDLVEQNYDELLKYGVKNVGRLYSKHKEPNYITCATVQSVHLLEPHLKKIKAFFIDEVHEMMTKRTKWALAKMVEAYMRIGMSATAFKFDGTDKIQKYEVKGWVGPLFKTKCTESGKLTINELQDRDILSSATCQFLLIDEPKLPYEVYGDAVTKGIAENNYFNSVVSQLADRCPGRTLILVERIEQGDRLKDLLPDAYWIRGEDDTATRKAVKQKLQNNDGKCVAIATQHIFTAGINVFIHNLINAAGGKAHHQIVQRFGRGLRKADDKKHLYYYDFFFNINDYLLKHSKERIKILQKEGHNLTVHKHCNLEAIEYCSDDT